MNKETKKKIERILTAHNYDFITYTNKVVLHLEDNFGCFTKFNLTTIKQTLTTIGY